jgi:hypothetical protein
MQTETFENCELPVAKELLWNKAEGGFYHDDWQLRKIKTAFGT